MININNVSMKFNLGIEKNFSLKLFFKWWFFREFCFKNINDCLLLFFKIICFCIVVYTDNWMLRIFQILAKSSEIFVLNVIGECKITTTHVEFTVSQLPVFHNPLVNVTVFTEFVKAGFVKCLVFLFPHPVILIWL